MNCYNLKKEAFEKNVQDICKLTNVSGADSITDTNSYYLNLLQIEEFKNNQKQLLRKPKSKIHIELEDWFAERKFDVYLTVTLRKSITSDNGTPWKIKQENIESTADKLKKGITRKLATRRKKLNFAVFLEEQENNRPHLHILLSTPRNFSFHTIQSKIYSVLIETDWVYKEWDIQSVYNQNGVVKYNLKTGFNAFQPISCSISE